MRLMWTRRTSGWMFQLYCKRLCSSSWPRCCSSALQRHLKVAKRDHAIIAEKLASGGVHSREIAGLYKKMSRLEVLLKLADDAESVSREADEYAELIHSIGQGTGGEKNDPALYQEAKCEMERCKAEAETFQSRMLESIIPQDEEDEGGAIVEVRAGTGGDEGSLFAADLFGMYEKFAHEQRWSWKQIQYSSSSLGGCKEASALLGGDGVFGMLKFESGLHRVQRVPINDVRVHTSAATVAVLPEAGKDITIKINPADLKIEVYRASGAGGQHVNTTESAVRITHVPTGISAAIQDERSQHQNRAKAMLLVRSRLYAAEVEAKRRDIDARRAAAMGSGERSDRVRTYNFPQDRMTDHRCNETRHDIKAMLRCEAEAVTLKGFIAALRNADMSQKVERLLQDGTPS